MTDDARHDVAPGTAAADGPLPTEPDGCESCGVVGDELVCVRRMYVTPESWDTPGRVEPGELEWWCFVCTTHYPHQIPA